MKVYTKRGDKGQTDLFSGGRVNKNDSRIEANGNIDELSSFLGLLKCKLDIPDKRETITTIQKSLIKIMTSVVDESKNPDFFIMEEEVCFIERLIDSVQKEYPPLKEFVIYGKNELSALADVSRSVVRRAERSLISCAETHNIEPNAIIYLNRLSDYFFSLARFFDYTISNH